MLNYQAVLLHFLNPDGDKLSDLSGAIGSSHGKPMVEATRDYIVTKLAERLIGTAEKCAPAGTPEPTAQVESDLAPKSPPLAQTESVDTLTPAPVTEYWRAPNAVEEGEGSVIVGRKDESHD